ncbi:hypothetical protein CVT26_000588, partial [Gymnopilus dilepis]
RLAATPAPLVEPVASQPTESDQTSAVVPELPHGIVPAKAPPQRPCQDHGIASGFREELAVDLPQVQPQSSHSSTPPRQATPPHARSTPPLSPRVSPKRSLRRAAHSPYYSPNRRPKVPRISPPPVTSPRSGSQTAPANAIPAVDHPPSTVSSAPSQLSAAASPSANDSHPVPSAHSDARYTTPPSYPTPPSESEPEQPSRLSRKRRSVDASNEVRTSKRLRTLSGAAAPSSSAEAISPPPNAPTWFSNALLLLQAGDLGSQWRSLLESWVRFEVEADFKERGKLGNQGRPPYIAEWIQRRRSRTWRPVFDVDEVGEKFMTWWTSLQPEWRVSGESLVVSAVDGSWDALRKPGLNGLYSVLVALLYWGSEAVKDPEKHDAWSRAVDDVHLALSQMLRNDKEIVGG